MEKEPRLKSLLPYTCNCHPEVRTPGLYAGQNSLQQMSDKSLPHPFTEEEISAALQNDETSDSPRLRQHPCGIPEEPGPQSSHLAVKFFSRIMATHSIPKIWRKAKVTAVEKPGKDPSLAANYRQISLLSVCYKLLEHLALQRISPTVEGYSVQTRLVSGKVEALVTRNLKTGAVFLDLTAAYDTVWHTGLLYKLSKSMSYWFTRLVSLLL